MILSRLLTPEDFGVYTIAAAALALALVVRDLGVGNYLIHEKDLTQDRIRTAFGVSLIIGLTLGGMLFVMSGPAGQFYAEPGLSQALRVLSFTFLLIPFSSPSLAMLRREMAFNALFWVGIANALAVAVTGALLAALDFGFMSLAWAAVAGAVATTVAAVCYCPQIAAVRPSFKEWRRVAAFGSMSSLAGVVGNIGWKATDLVIGRMLGFEALGLFNRATSLWSLFNRTVMEAVMPVMTPAFAVKYRAKDDLLGPYLKGLSYVTVLAWPFFVFLGLMAYPIVRIMFGNQWDAAVPLLQIMCLAAIFRPLYYFTTPVFIALGEVKKYLASELIIQPLRIALILGAAFHSLEAVVFISSTVAGLTFAVSYYYIRDLIGLSLAAVAVALKKSFIVALCSALAPFAVHLNMEVGPDNTWGPLLVAAFGAGIAWVGSVLVIKHPISTEASLIRQLLRGMVEAKQAGLPVERNL